MVELRRRLPKNSEREEEEDEEREWVRRRWRERKLRGERGRGGLREEAWLKFPTEEAVDDADDILTDSVPILFFCSALLCSALRFLLAICSSLSLSQFFSGPLI